MEERYEAIFRVVFDKQGNLLLIHRTSPDYFNFQDWPIETREACEKFMEDSIDYL